MTRFDAEERDASGSRTVRVLFSRRDCRNTVDNKHAAPRSFPARSRELTGGTAPAVTKAKGTLVRPV